ncbi:MAG: hypothetical protein RSC76_00510 [Oscillospiraceae bacterium]
MSEILFPRTNVGGLSVSRMIMGTNWLLGWSHTSPSADKMITDRYPTKESFLPMFEAYLSHGVDTVMGPLSQNAAIIPAIKYAEDRLGKEIIMIDTPQINVNDSKEARQEAEKQIKKSAADGCKICMIHQVMVEKIMNQLDEKFDRIDDYTKMMRDNGLIPGLGTHSPETIQYCDQNNYDVETYIQLYNPMGFLMRHEVETIAATIQNAKKPVLTIKAMAAGRTTPYVGLTFVWNTIRPQDMVAVGAFTPQEVHEDIEFSMAALEHRFPTAVLGGGIVGQANDAKGFNVKVD